MLLIQIQSLGKYHAIDDGPKSSPPVSALVVYQANIRDSTCGQTCNRMKHLRLIVGWVMWP